MSQLTDDIDRILTAQGLKPGSDDLRLELLHTALVGLRNERDTLLAATTTLEDQVAALRKLVSRARSAMKDEDAFRTEAREENDRDPDGLGGGYICGTPKLCELRDRADQTRESSIHEIEIALT